MKKARIKIVKMEKNFFFFKYENLKIDLFWKKEKKKENFLFLKKKKKKKENLYLLNKIHSLVGLQPVEISKEQIWRWT
jgi:hypothetical protein